MEFLNNQFRDEIRKVVHQEMALNAPTIEPLAQPLEIVNQKTLCERFDLSEPTVIRWRDKGLIPFMRVGSAVRYDVNLVAKALEFKNKKRVTK